MSIVSVYTNFTDQELVLRLKIENEAKPVFTELYNRYWKRMLIQALYKLKSEPEAEEIVQDVFMNLWRRRERLEIKNTLHTYIASSVKYEILSRLAKQKTKIEFEKKATGLYVVTDDHVTNQVDYETTRRNLEQTVKGLPEKCQLVFRLSREDGMTEKQIAEELQISTKTVEAHITKALKTLRTSLHQLFNLLW